MGSSATEPQPANDPSPSKADSQKPLPKLTPSEFKTYNHLAEHMNLFHENFRRTYTLLLTSSKSNSRPQGMSARQFLTVAEEFCHHLTLHHTIEERHIFPVLAKKMPAFRKELELLTQHKLIHEGIERLEEYVRECKGGERELRLREMGEILEGFGEVLFRHLDEEVEELRGENMRLYWSLEEMRRMPM